MAITGFGSRRIWTWRSSTFNRPTPPSSTGAAAGPVDGVRREGGDAHGEVLGPVGRLVAHSGPGPDQDGLAGPHVDRRPAVVVDDERPRQHDRVLVELRLLSRLRPARRAIHERDRQLFVAGRHPPTN